MKTSADRNTKMEEEKEQLTDNNEVGEPPSDEVSMIVQQALEVYDKKNRTLMKTHFYKIVLAGNVEIIENTLKYMDENNLKHVKDWLLQRNITHGRRSKRQTTKVKQVIAFVILFLFVCVTAPLFYFVHYILNLILNRKQKRISKNIELPLVFAAFSQKRPMISFFSSSGFDFNDSDPNGNNLFHYIADLSSTASTKAIDIFDVVIRYIDDADTGRKLLQEMKNTSGLTAIEYTVKYGSPALLTHMLSYPQLISQMKFEANEDSIVYGNSSKKIRESLVDKTSIEHVDVSMYEIGTLRNQSKLLNLLSDRNVLEMTKSDLVIFDQSALVGKWIYLKIKQMFCGVISFHLLDIVPTILLLVIVSGQFLGRFKASLDMLTRWEVYHEELQAVANEKSVLFKAERYKEVFENACAHQQYMCLQRYALRNEEIQNLLINKTITEYPDYEREIRKILTHDEFENDFSIFIIQKILQNALIINEIQDSWPKLYVCYSLPEIFRNLTDNLLHHFASRKLDLNLETFLTYFNEVVDVYSNYKVSYQNTSVNVDDIFTLEQITDLVCIKKEFYKKEDLLLKSNFHFSNDIKVDGVCHRKALEIMLTGKCRSTTISDMEVEESEKYQAEIRANLVVLAYGVLSVIYCFIDLFERFVFIYISIAGQKHLKEIFVTFFSCKVPGSYARKQINFLTYLVMLFVFVVLIYFYDILIALEITSTKLSSIIKYIVATNLIFRLVMHIHAMRLFPGIGNFVITTFMMGTNLIHFSIVFGIVIVIFAVMFELLIYNPECPYENAVGFETVWKSLFSTFRLTFGHGELEPFFTNTPAMFTYALYMIIAGLLALNLIIAIMSTTAMDVMSEPWKQRLWDIEWLDEATSVEFTISVLSMLCRRCCHRKVKMLNKSGYVVKQKAGQNKVFIELFHSTALESGE